MEINYRNMIRNFFKPQFLKFIAVGILNTVFSYTVYAALIFFHTPYIIAGIIQTILGVLFSFKTFGFFVFKQKSNNVFLRFCLGYTFLSVFYIVGLRLIHTVYANNYINGVIVLIPYVLLSYFVNKKYIFKDKK